MLTAADDLATGLTQALLVIRQALEEIENWVVEEREFAGLADLKEARRLIDEAAARVARCELLFGIDSPAAMTATSCMTALRHAVWDLEEKGDIHSIWERAGGQYTAARPPRSGTSPRPRATPSRTTGACASVGSEPGKPSRARAGVPDVVSRFECGVDGLAVPSVGNGDGSNRWACPLAQHRRPSLVRRAQRRHVFVVCSLNECFRSCCRSASIRGYSRSGTCRRRPRAGASHQGHSVQGRGRARLRRCWCDLRGSRG